MGNRAVIAFDKYEPDAIGLYLHWNGGRDSIDGLLAATQSVMKSRGADSMYARARLVQVIGQFFGGNLSFGMDYCKNLDCDNYDNGVYIVDSETLEITGREFNHGSEQKGHEIDEIKEYALNRVNHGTEYKDD